MRGQAQALSSARGAGRGSDEWQTPTCVLDRVRMVAPIALDPCTTADNPVGAARHFAIKDDGLEGPWAGVVGAVSPRGLCFVNPAYSKMAAWAAKMVAEAALGCPIIALVASRTDTRWFRALWNVADAVALWRGRLSFINPTAAKAQPAPFPSALIALNISQRRFKAAFADVCEVVVPT